LNIIYHKIYINKNELKIKEKKIAAGVFAKKGKNNDGFFELKSAVEELGKEKIDDFSGNSQQLNYTDYQSAYETK
jgi:hypothetical protein